MTDPKISVIIPVFNGEKFVSRGIQSVLDQEYPAHEILVVDDGSTDQTSELLRGYSDRIITKRIKNSGVSVARNTAMAMATGDFFAFLDADDLWFKNKLKREAEFISQYPEIGFFCCNYSVRYPHLGRRLVKQYAVLRNPRELNFDSPLKKDAFELLIKEHFVGTASAVVIKKELVEKVGHFDPSFKIAEDYEYWLRCATATNFLLISEPLFYKKSHPVSLSADALRTQIILKQVLESVLLKHRVYIESHGLRNIFRQTLTENNYCLGNVYFDSGEPGKAFRSYFTGLRAHFTLSNLGLFCWAVFKKSARMLSFGLFSRRKLEGLQ